MNASVVLMIVFVVVIIGNTIITLLSTEQTKRKLSIIFRSSLSRSTNVSRWKPHELVVIPAIWNEINWANVSAWPAWLSNGLKQSSQYRIHLYQRKSPNSTAPYTWPYVVNVHEETGVYLKFIIDYYYDLPDKMLFIHGNPYAHSSHPIESALCVRDDVHFANINRLWIRNRSWTYWARDPIDNIGAMYKCAAYILSLFGFDGESQLNPEKKQPKDNNIISTRCCAQFYVTKQRIHHYSFKQWSAAYRANLEVFCGSNITSEKSGERDIKWFGGGFEHLWHVILGLQPVQMLPPRSGTHNDNCHLFQAGCPGSPCSNNTQYTIYV